MLIYWLLLIGSLVIGIPLCRVKYGREIFCGISGVALFLTAAFRYDVGYDYNLYGSWYVNAQSMSMEEMMYMRPEKGYLIPMKLLSDVFADYQTMFYVVAFVLTVGIMLYIYFYSEKPYLSVFFFLTFGLFFYSVNFMRQMIAAVIMMYALQYIKKKQFFRFLVLAVFASTFHISAIVLIPFYFILMIPMNWITLGVYGGVSVLSFVFITPIITLVTKYFYKGYSNLQGAEVANGMNPIYCCLFLLFFLISFLVRKELIRKDSFNNVLLNCAFFNFFFELMGVRHGILSRLSILFVIPAVIILFPRVLVIAAEKAGDFFRGRKNAQTAAKAVAVTVLMGICTGMYGYMISDDYNGIYPYQTIFSANEEVSDNG